MLETLSDIIQVVYFKATHGKRFFKMAPLHHHLERCGWSENKIVVVFCGLTLLCSALAYWGISGALRVNSDIAELQERRECTCASRAAP